MSFGFASLVSPLGSNAGARILKIAHKLKRLQ
jgi:hypothetical protein